MWCEERRAMLRRSPFAPAAMITRKWDPLHRPAR